MPEEKENVEAIASMLQIMNFKLNGILEMETNTPKVTHVNIKSLSFIGLVHTSICWRPKTTDAETKAKVKFVALEIKLLFVKIQQINKLEKKQHAYLKYM
jgi:hypothetical protein